MRPYVITYPTTPALYLPKFRASAGWRQLEKLIEKLRERGFTAIRTLDDGAAKMIEDGAIVVYHALDVGFANAVNAKRSVIWWIGTATERETRPVFYYQHTFKGVDVDLLTLNIFDQKLFNMEGIEKRDINTTWVGKGDAMGFIGVDIPDQVDILYGYPKTREEVAALLKRSKHLFTVDCNTALTIEARLCGCIPVMIPNSHYPEDKARLLNDQWGNGVAFNPSEAEIANAIRTLPGFKAQFDEIWVNHEKEQLDRFIEITQNLPLDKGVV